MLWERSADGCGSCRHGGPASFLGSGLRRRVPQQYLFLESLEWRKGICVEPVRGRWQRAARLRKAGPLSCRLRAIPIPPMHRSSSWLTVGIGPRPAVQGAAVRPYFRSAPLPPEFWLQASNQPVALPASTLPSCQICSAHSRISRICLSLIRLVSEMGRLFSRYRGYAYTDLLLR